jgi:hypothetical protein
MNIIDYGEIKICENNLLKTSIFFEKNFTISEMKLLSEGKTLIFNENFPLSYFKIIDTNYTIRGSLESNRITIDFNTADKEKYQIYFADFLHLLDASLPSA